VSVARTYVLYVLLVLSALSPGPCRAASAVDARYREAVDTAVARGLAFLAATQNDNGSFGHKFSKAGRCPGIIALAGMAFLADGHTPNTVPYGPVVTRCVDYVLRCQYDNGLIARGHHTRGPMYSHCICSLFLSEVSGMVDPARQAQIDEVQAKALHLIIASQQVQKEAMYRGGWRYQAFENKSDSSVSGWAIMALRSARLNGAPVPDEAIRDGIRYLLTCRNPDTGGFGYGVPGTGVAQTGVGLLCLELAGHHGEPITVAAANCLLGLHRGIGEAGYRYYTTYYASQGMFQAGPQYWEAYAPWLYEFWLSRQSEDGSWGYDGKYADRTYSTAMIVLSLTVPYRQLPIYQRDETVPE